MRNPYFLKIQKVVLHCSESVLLLGKLWFLEYCGLSLLVERLRCDDFPFVEILEWWTRFEEERTCRIHEGFSLRRLDYSNPTLLL